jgi:hypothetical protein
MLIILATSQELFLLDQSNFEAVVVFLSNPQQCCQASLSGACHDSSDNRNLLCYKQTIATHL